MNITWAIILGAIQGITEILPISSSAHLILFPWFLKMPDQGLSFDVALHLGSLLAIIIAFGPDWINLIQELPKLVKNKLKATNQNQKIIYYLLLATIPGTIAGILFESLIETKLRSELVIVFTLFIYGGILWYVDKKGQKGKTLSDIGLKDALFIGLAQMFALVPGTSRSGITISAGLFRGLKKEVAAKFSFMLSAPIIFGAGIVKVPKIALSDLVSAYFILGVISSFVFALLAIKFILGFVKKYSYKYFAFYRFGLAALILIFIFLR